MVQGKGTQISPRKYEPKRTFRQKLEFTEAKVAKHSRTHAMEEIAMWKQSSTNTISIEYLTDWLT